MMAAHPAYLAPSVPDEFRNLCCGSHRLACPECAKDPKDKALSVTVEHRGGVYHCFRCGWSGHWIDNVSYERTKRPYERASYTDRHLTLAAHYRDFWRGLAPPYGVSREYLKARKCALPPVEGDLRCCESLRHPSGYIGPALVGLVTHAVTGEPLTLHRTWVCADGSKAVVDPPRMLLGKHQKRGGVIRLWPDHAVTTGLAIAEGIETALTAAHAFQPVWSLIDAGNLSQFAVLNGIESLLIVADNDAGLRASYQCAKRWHNAKREVRIASSPNQGEDLNDFARRSA
jgi:hypothetical protein